MSRWSGLVHLHATLLLRNESSLHGELRNGASRGRDHTFLASATRPEWARGGVSLPNAHIQTNSILGQHSYTESGLSCQVREAQKIMSWRA